MDITFTKMQGSGNDFIVIDEWKGEAVPDGEREEFVRRACDRHFGVGADGAIFIRKSSKADVNFIFHNPDGSRAEMCGNGIRCLAKYAYEHGLARKDRLDVETAAGVRRLELKVEEGRVVEVKVDMGRPQVRRGEAQVAGDPDGVYIGEKTVINSFEYTITAVGMGNPHAVLFYDDVNGVDVKTVGSRIRNHRKLFPKGVNVHFVQKLKGNEFRIRSYERGVEDETLACGTGICAAAAAAALNGKADAGKPLLFHSRGGDLKVELERAGKDIKRVRLTGPAEEVFTGRMKV